MILVVRKRNIILVSTLFLLLLIIYSFNFVKDNSSPVANAQNVQRAVIIDAGHGGEDPGAVSDYSGMKEKDINLSIAMRVGELLEKENFKVIFTRKEDKLEYQAATKNITQKRKEDLLRRKKVMDDSGADIVVSIHLNKFPQTQYFGTQIFFPPNSPGSQKLAMSIQKSVRTSVAPENTREALVKKEPIIILKDFKTVTAIVECGFLSNVEEEKKLASKEYQEKLAVAIRDGIKDYFGK